VEEEGRERITGYQVGVRVRIAVVRERPREDEVPPAMTTVGISRFAPVPVD